MSCYLLTGATGLLGVYLLRDLLQAGHELALVIRSKRHTPAEKRLDDLLKHWEVLGVSLPRPKVFDGDITERGLGLSRDARGWVSRNCTGMIHSAASLKFREADGEPWLSNLVGTENTVSLAEELGVNEFHYISTAYVCGKAGGFAYELPVSSNVEPRNVYEESKGRAERRVYEADLSQPATILRPSIIIGDSENGYTSTFHGAYAPLRQAMALRMAIGGTPVPGSTAGAVNARNVLRLMGMNGQETKNLVPVDWVSRNIARVVSSPEYHGNFYHLTASQPALVELLTRVTAECMMRSLGIDPEESQEEARTNPEVEEMFCTLLSVYREYWTDDPQFDNTGISVVAPDDPCPTVDAAMLRRTFEFAIDAMLEPPRAGSRT